MNKFSDGVIRAIVEQKKEVYNPVYFYGEPLRVIETLEYLIEKYRPKHPEAVVKHLAARQYTEQLIKSLANGDIERLRCGFSDCDMLIFERIDDIAGMMMTMQEFYGLFDRLWESGKQIVLTAAVPPKEIAELEERIITQLESGIICNVDEIY